MSQSAAMVASLLSPSGAVASSRSSVRVSLRSVVNGVAAVANSDVPTSSSPTAQGTNRHLDATKRCFVVLGRLVHCHDQPINLAIGFPAYRLTFMNMLPLFPRPSVAPITFAAFICAAIFVPTSLMCHRLAAQDTPTKKYSPEVVAKAEKVLQDSGLRRSGKTIQATGTSHISRAIASLTREKRELRLIDKEWKKTADQIKSLKQQVRRLNAQDVDLNLQLARVAQADVKSSNRIIALLNASRGQAKTLVDQRGELTKQLAAKRSSLSDAESQYADTVLAIRKDYSAAHQAISQSLDSEQVKISLRVMQVNFASPAIPSPDKILSALDKRISKIEQEIFSETISMEVAGGALMVDVAIGSKTIRMVVDSGASIVCLPSSTAAGLGIKIPLDARVIQLVLADGRQIPARGVTLPRIRVGEFEAENVEAAVLDPIAVQAKPLLGMSFLGKFRFSIDRSEKSLKLLRVATE